MNETLTRHTANSSVPIAGMISCAVSHSFLLKQNQQLPSHHLQYEESILEECRFLKHMSSSVCYAEIGTCCGGYVNMTS